MKAMHIYEVATQLMDFAAEKRSAATAAGHEGTADIWHGLFLVFCALSDALHESAGKDLADVMAGAVARVIKGDLDS